MTSTVSPCPDVGDSQDIKRDAESLKGFRYVTDGLKSVLFSSEKNLDNGKAGIATIIIITKY